MDYKNIVLSDADIRALKKSKPIPEEDCKELRHFKLVDAVMRSGSSGSMPVNTGMYVVNDDGKRYLRFLSLQRREYFKLKWAEFVALGVSMTSLILSLLAFLQTR